MNKKLIMCMMTAGLTVFTLSNVSGITLTPVTTGFNNPIGIDHHETTNQVVMSVNYPSGQPYNFELVAADGTRTQFSSISGLTNEVKIATARDDGGGISLGGFTPGELFTGSGVPGVIVRISPDGSVVQNPWVTLPGETGLLRGSLHIDRTGVFGGDLIVVTTHGRVWRVDVSGNPTQLASIGTHLEGVTTVPDDPAKYGPWAGKILAGAEQQTRIYTIDPQGNTAFYTLGIKPEDIDIIPANENFFGVDYGGRTLWGAPPSEFAGMVGDVLIAQEFPGILWHVRWDAGSSSFQTANIAQVQQWEHVTFSTAGIVEICPLNTSTTIVPDTMYVFQANSIDPLMATVYLYDFPQGYSANDVNTSTLLVNDTISSVSSSIIPPDTLTFTIPMRDFILYYGWLWDTTGQTFTVTGQFNDDTCFSAANQVIMIGHTSGDLNFDGVVNVADLTLLVDFLFAGGSPPAIMVAADLDGNCAVNIADLTYLVGYLFAGGPKPMIPCGHLE